VIRHLLLAVGLAAVVAGETGKSHAGQGSGGRIAGLVTAADTGRPLAGATVTIHVDDNGVDRNRTTRTDASGSFQFSDVPAGRRVKTSASAQRYMTLSYGQDHPGRAPYFITLSEGQSFALTLVLPRLGVLAGRVIDPFGDPLPGVSVFAFRDGEERDLVAAGRSIPPRPTDDLGQFRIEGLLPGDYRVGMIAGALTAAPFFNSTNETGGFVPTFFPSATSSGAAQAIRVGPGTDREDLIIQAIAGRAGRVAGRVVDSTGRPFSRALIAITPAADAGLNVGIAGRAQASADGEFAFSRVPPGGYVVQARSLGTTDAFEGEYGWVSVTVSDADVRDVLVSTSGPSAIRGRVVLDGVAEAAVLSDLQIVAQPFDAGVTPVIRIASVAPRAWPDSEGRFHLQRLWGRPVLRLITQRNVVLERVTAGGKDVTDAPLELNGTDITDVEVAVSSRAAHVNGRVSSADGGPVAECQVLVFAADPQRWTPYTRFVASSPCQQDGGFVVRGLPPGRYLAAARSGSRSGPASKALLASIRSAAVPLDLSEGITQDVALTISDR
jgi:Carboxypeptidase regulatory-like domain